MPQRAGRMRHVIEWQEPTLVKSGASATNTWATTETRRASIDPTGGREYVNGERVIGETTHMIQVRAIPNLAPEDRFLETKNSRIFHIVAIADLTSRGATMNVQVREVLD